jgi:hypothetical protein
MVGRVDYVMSDKNRIYTSLGKTSETIYSPRTFTGILANGTSSPGQNNTNHGVADWTSMLSPTLTLDAKLGYARSLSGRSNSDAAGYNLTQLGFPASLVSQFKQAQFPTFTFSTFGTFGPSQVNSVSAASIVDGHIDLAKSWGKHFLRMGTEFIQYGSPSTNYGFASGTYAFNHPFFTTMATLATTSTQFGQLNVGGGQNNSPCDIFLEGNIIF